MTRLNVFVVSLAFVIAACLLHEGLASDKDGLTALSRNSLSSAEFPSVGSESHAVSLLEPAVEKSSQYYQHDARAISKEEYNGENRDYDNYNYMEIFGYQGHAGEGPIQLHNTEKYDLWTHKANSAIDKDYYTLDRKTAGKQWNKNYLLWKEMRRFQGRRNKPKESPYDLATVNTGGWGK